MKKLLLWFTVNLVILVSIPVIYYIYLDRLVDYEYATGIRTSTGGDIVLIPVAGLFIFVLLVLLIANVLAGGFFILVRRQQNLP
jgi:hypothetical protein